MKKFLLTALIFALVSSCVFGLVACDDQPNDNEAPNENEMPSDNKTPSENETPNNNDSQDKDNNGESLENTDQNGQNNENSNDTDNELEFSQELRFILNSDQKSYSVTGIATNNYRDVVIPSTHNSLPVTAIISL